MAEERTPNIRRDGAILKGGIRLSDEIDEIYSRISALSARELEVLRLVTTGMTNWSIGLELGISERTAREHISRIMLKLRVGSRVEIAVIATKWSLLSRACRFGESGRSSYGRYTSCVSAVAGEVTKNATSLVFMSLQCVYSKGRHGSCRTAQFTGSPTAQRELDVSTSAARHSLP